MRAELENVYGPTECTCICSAHTVSAADFEDMQNLAPLGLPAQNFDFEILPLDEAAPDFGELFLRGPQVGLGYYNDPERTARSFIQNPNHSLYADIGYRTGDLVRRDARGWLHFKGRADFQIKHMGYRIALEEIEAHSEYCVMSRNVRLSTRNSATDLGKSPSPPRIHPVPPEALLQQIAAIVPPYDTQARDCSGSVAEKRQRQDRSCCVAGCRRFFMRTITEVLCRDCRINRYGADL